MTAAQSNVECSRCIVPIRLRPDAQVRVVAVHFAGSAASYFHRWKPFLGTHIDLLAMQLPGREHRLCEPFSLSVPACAAATATALRDYADKPLVLFGHSLGALLAYELASQVKHLGWKVALIVSGEEAPHLPRRRQSVKDLSEQEFRRFLQQYNGTPPEILANDELYDFFLPRIRADFLLSESYAWYDREKLGCPVVGLAGDNDPDVTIPGLESWQETTTGPFEWQLFEGDHFYINNNPGALTEWLDRSARILLDL